MSELKMAAVVGAGVMGHGIAQVLAQAGVEVMMVDVKDEFIWRAFDSIEKSIALMVKKSKLSQDDAAGLLARIEGTTDLKAAVDGVDLVIEAIPEDLYLKQSTFTQLDELCPAHAILATNTSTISITAIASATARPDKVIGIHFATPVQVMIGVEIIRGLETSDETVVAAERLVKLIGKKSYIVLKDAPGFIGNRLLPLFLNEAFNLLWEGVGSADSIDQSMKLSLGHPMGPLELADLIGLDQLLKGIEYLYLELGEKFRPSPMLKQLVSAGHYGRKTGRGVYDYRGN